MEIFKKIHLRGKNKMEICRSRIFIANLPFSEADQCARAVEWDQCHYMKKENGYVDLSLITGQKIADEVYFFVHEDDDNEPGPQYA